MEFCDPDTFTIILATSEEDYQLYKLKDLYPLGFGSQNL
jgi:cytidine deaminase